MSLADLPPLPQVLVDWAQVVGAVAALIAIVVSFFALWRQRRDQLRDQRYASDLQELRELQRRIGDMLEDPPLVRGLVEGQLSSKEWQRLLFDVRTVAYRLHNRQTRILIESHVAAMTGPGTVKQLEWLAGEVEVEASVLRARHLGRRLWS